MMNRDNPVWLITGCSTGFGRELAKLVLERGWRAVVTARDTSKVADIVEGHGDRALVLPLDVTKRAQIDHAVAQAKEHFGRIDVLVNNAGYGYLAASRKARTRPCARCSRRTCSASSTRPRPCCR